MSGQSHPWYEIMRGPKHTPGDFMQSEREYRDALTSVAFCPKCHRTIPFKMWGMNNSDKEKIEGLMKWSEWKEWNQYEDRRTTTKRRKDNNHS